MGCACAARLRPSHGRVAIIVMTIRAAACALCCAAVQQRGWERELTLLSGEDDVALPPLTAAQVALSAADPGAGAWAAGCELGRRDFAPGWVARTVRIRAAPPPP